MLDFNVMLWNAVESNVAANIFPVLVGKIGLKIRTFHTSLFFRISRGQTPISRGCCLYKNERRKKDTLGMGSGGDVSYTSAFQSTSYQYLSPD